MPNGQSPNSQSREDTAALLRAGLARQRAGDLEAAAHHYERALAASPHHPDARWLLATLELQRQHFARARELLEAIAASRPGDARVLHPLGHARLHCGDAAGAIAALEDAAGQAPQAEVLTSLAQALDAAGRDDAALATYRRAAERAPDNPGVLNNLGLAEQSAGNEDAALEAYRRALALAPDYPDALTNLGRLHHARGEWGRALAQHDRARALSPGSPAIEHNRGATLWALDRLREAAEAFRSALAADPDFAHARAALGAVLSALGQPEAALTTLRAGLADDENAPVDPELAVRLGDTLKQLGRPDEAERHYRRALDAAPQSADAHAGLADLAERRNLTHEARRVAETGLALQPAHPLLNIVAARCQRREGDIDAACARLETLTKRPLAPGWRQTLAYELGRLRDATEDTDGAMAWLTEANALAHARWKAIQPQGNAYLADVERCQQVFTAEWVASWPADAPDDNRRDPIFLIGFPRSGTTLLDRALDGHPGLRVLDERPLLDRLRAALAEGGQRYPDVLAELDSAELASLRARYFAELANDGGVANNGGVGAAELDDPTRPRLVDKLPLNTVHAGLIRRLFPRAPILVALRHPCDACLSCFMQELGQNEAMANFHSLDDTTAFYARVMSLWQRYTQVLDLHYHSVRYEDLVADFKGTLRGVLDFLGLEWDEAVLAYSQRAVGGHISTPSYHQVAQPIYSASVGRWQRYRQALAPYLERLRPFAEAYGYEL